MKLTIPEHCLVVLVGASGSGKSTFAARHFKPFEVLSSDYCRGLVSDDETDQSATSDAFDVLYFIAGKRLAAGKLTVIDATSVQEEARRQAVLVARQHHCLPVAIVFDMPESLCRQRNATRSDRSVAEHVIRRQRRELKASLRKLKKEGFRYVYVLTTENEAEQATLERQPLWNNLKHEHGPFDIIGDVHGCLDELLELLSLLGYRIDKLPQEKTVAVKAPPGRKAIFLGDLVDRGPATPAVLALVMSMVASGDALCVPGNHDIKLLKKLKGRDVRITHGLAESLAQLDCEPSAFKEEAASFLESLVSHYVLDDGKLVVAHAGMKESYQGRGSAHVKDFALYGETTGERDDYGLPVRLDWAADYRGAAMVVYGHTPVASPEWVNRTVCIDTGCVFGGKLTAMRYPEKEFVSVPAARQYYEPVKPFLKPDLEPSQPEASNYILAIEDVAGKRVVETRLQRHITVHERNSAAALEVMSRFAVDPRWLVYLPPTMSPCETSKEPDLLEHPLEAFEYYRQQGVPRVVCQEKHMGSRAVVIVCRSEEAAQKRFGVSGQGKGICYTRTGRRFFNDLALEEQFIEKVGVACRQAGLFEELGSDWVVLDCELMPWSAKAQELLKDQYAAVGAAANIALAESLACLETASKRGLNVEALADSYRQRHKLTDLFRQSYRRYCWAVNSLADYKLAPFHILASEGAVHSRHNHQWHMEKADCLAKAGQGLIIATRNRLVDLSDAGSIEQAVSWWEDLTSSGGEGMVVKPLDFIADTSRGLSQPAVKCRGREYLRIIYGAEYTMENNLERLKARGLSAKRRLALREFALSLESLERFVAGEPLYRVHECVFALLALESEPVDPRL